MPSASTTSIQGLAAGADMGSCTNATLDGVDDDFPWPRASGPAFWRTQLLVRSFLPLALQLLLPNVLRQCEKDQNDPIDVVNRNKGRIVI